METLYPTNNSGQTPLQSSVVLLQDCFTQLKCNILVQQNGKASSHGWPSDFSNALCDLLNMLRKHKQKCHSL